MTDERSALVFLLKISYADAKHHERIEEQMENIETMKRIIEINPQLEAEERNILSYVYKVAIDRRRNVLRQFPTFFLNVEENSGRYNKLLEFQETLLSEIDSTCLDLCDLIESKLQPVAYTPESRMFYEKLLGDSYRYMAEFKSEDSSKEYIEKAGTHYQTALDIAKQSVNPTSAEMLGLVLNYTVFLYDIMEKKQEAIEIALKTYQDTVDLLDGLSEDSYAEASDLLRLINSNYNNWTSTS